ncbi:ABC transporter substrate-binding protein [Falsirhodobacter deserti]|uniref:ABC transporter substrate-binding protein n=1 Tax=Falsirhodobacter deserti TaxID=1365611 RepID=UPI000FE34109|nr:ABC transporter substrate-binding protein [Falsirhodobacter deserti]
MKRLSLLAGLMLSASAATAQDKVTIEFVYPYSAIFDVTYEAILPRFQEAHPDIEVKFRASYEEYEDASNTILREAVSGNLPDVTMQGLNRQQILVEKRIAQPLDPFITDEADFEVEGYHEAMLDLSTFDGKVYGLPFSVSLPVGFYNTEVMTDAGIDGFPTTWNEVIADCGTLRESGYENPIFWDWQITGNWLFQALMWSQDKPIVEGAAMTLDSPEALVALQTIQKIVTECGMKNLSVEEAITSFTAGEIPMLFSSTSYVGRITRGNAELPFTTASFPGIEGAPLGLPAGGNAAMMTSTSDDPAVRAAAWEWIKFLTSGEGAADVARTTGYMPPNRAANELILTDFYSRYSEKAAAVQQLPLMREWQAYPGANGLAITQVIYDGLERLVTGEQPDMEELQQELVDEVADLLPR